MYCVRMKGLSCLESICCWISENSALALSMSASLLPCGIGRRGVRIPRLGGCVGAAGRGWLLLHAHHVMPVACGI